MYIITAHEAVENLSKILDGYATIAVTNYLYLGSHAVAKKNYTNTD